MGYRASKKARSILCQAIDMTLAVVQDDGCMQRIGRCGQVRAGTMERANWVRAAWAALLAG